MASRATGGRRTVVFSVVLAVLVAAPAAAPAKPHSLGETDTTNVFAIFNAGDPPRVVDLDCPKGFVLLTSAWDESAHQTVTVIRQQSAGGATFEINTRGVETSVKLTIVCVRKGTKPARGDDGKRHRHKLKQKFVSRPVSLPGRGEFTQTGVSCPKGYVPLSGFFDGDFSSRITQSMPAGDGKSWLFGIEQLTNEDASGVVGTQCLKGKTTKNSGHNHEIETEYVSTDVEVPASPNPQQSGVVVEGEGECPDGMIPVGQGWDFLGHAFTFLNSWGLAFAPPPDVPRAKPPSGYSFAILNESTEQRAKIIATCLGTKTANGA